MSSPTQRSLKYLRDLGYPLVQVVERWNPYAKVRVDLFGIIDVLAVGTSDYYSDSFANIVAVQTTSGSNVSARVTKMKESDALPILKKAGILVVVHGWRKGSNGRWVLREIEL